MPRSGRHRDSRVIYSRCFTTAPSYRVNESALRVPFLRPCRCIFPAVLRFIPATDSTRTIMIYDIFFHSYRAERSGLDRRRIEGADRRGRCHFTNARDGTEGWSRAFRCIRRWHLHCSMLLIADLHGLRKAGASLIPRAVLRELWGIFSGYRRNNVTMLRLIDLFS